MFANIALALSCVGPSTTLLPGAPPVDVHQVHYKGTKLEVADLPEGIAPGVNAAIDMCAVWSKNSGYSLTLDPSGRVLLVCKRAGKKLKTELDLVQSVLERVDAWLPEPVAFPKDWQGKGNARTWGWLGDPRAEDIPIVYILSGESEQRALLEMLADIAPYVEPMIEGASELSGFTIPAPLVTAYIETATILEEYSPPHELVHRLTHMLLVQRGGRVPQWLVSGLAWEAEWDLGKGIWCFPSRNEFVFNVEHTAWQKLARDRAKCLNRKESFTTEALFALKRERFVREDAILAFGCGAFLARKHPKVIREFIAELSLDRSRGSYHDLGGGRWELNPSYSTSPERQLEILHELLGDDVLSDLTTWLQRLK
jgi:hypothetical protein